MLIFNILSGLTQTFENNQIDHTFLHNVLIFKSSDYAIVSIA